MVNVHFLLLAAFFSVGRACSAQFVIFAVFAQTLPIHDGVGKAEQETKGKHELMCALCEFGCSISISYFMPYSP